MRSQASAQGGRILPPLQQHAPVSCLFPAADAKHIHVLAGAPDGGDLVTQASAEDVAKLCSVLLLGLPTDERRSALRKISSYASKHYSEATGKDGRFDIVPITELMPEDATIPQLAQVWNGLALLLLALGSASADTSVGTVVANAGSMASGAPFASDPLVGERQNEVILAKAILEAALLDDSTAKQWFADMQLTNALQQLVEHAKTGTSDAGGSVETDLEILRDLYDCAEHELPLGGSPLSGSVLSDFFSNLADAGKKAIGTAISKAGQAIAAPTNGAEPKGPADIAPVTQGPETANESSQAALDASAQSAAEAVSGSVAAAKAALQQAKEAMEGGSATIAENQARLKNAALQAARLQWAEALLSAPDEVATILSAATPNMADSGSFLQSMLATLPAAKATGNLGTIKSMLYALKAAAGRGDGVADSLYSLISGDAMLEAVGAAPAEPADVVAAHSGLADAIARQRASLRTFALDLKSRSGARQDETATVLPDGEPTDESHAL